MNYIRNTVLPNRPSAEVTVEITTELDKVVADMYRQAFFGVSAFSCGQKSSAVL